MSSKRQEIARTILAPDRYPTQLEKAGSYWFPIMKNYLTIPFFTQDQWNKQIVREHRPVDAPRHRGHRPDADPR